MSAKWFSMSGVLAAVVLAAGCLPAAGGGGSGPIRIGAVNPDTGPLAALAVEARRGIELALEEVNAAGGVDGRKIEVLWEDDETNPQKAVTVATKLITQDNVVAIVGSPDSAVSNAMVEITRSNKIAQISPTASLDSLADATKNPQFFTMGMMDSLGAAKLASVVQARGGNAKVGILHDKTAWGIGGKDAFTNALQAVGSTPVDAQPADRGTATFTPQLTQLRSAGANAVFIQAIAPDSARATLNLKQMGWEPLVLGGPGFAVPGAYQASQGGMDGALYVDVFDDSRADVRAFAQKYQQKYNAPFTTGQSIQAYDAFKILVEGLKASKADKAKLPEAIEAVKMKTLMGPEGNEASFTKQSHAGVKLSTLVLRQFKPGNPALSEVYRGQ